MDIGDIKGGVWCHGAYIGHFVLHYCVCYFQGKWSSTHSEAAMLMRARLLYPNLTVLDVCHNVLTSLPTEVSDMTHLTELKIRFNKIREVKIMYGNCNNIKVNSWFCSLVQNWFRNKFRVLQLPGRPGKTKMPS